MGDPKITLRFVTGADVVSAGIRVGEYGYWATHVEAVMPDGTYLGAHFDGGVQARSPDYDKSSFTREQFIRLPCNAAQSESFNRFLQAQIGKPYDIEAIAALVAGRDWRSPDSWFCSELQAAALEACGWFATRLASSVAKITPRDLLLILSACVPVLDA
ncbi:MAG TPA: hypothetical protein VKW08_07710 [Xanthobacteraceae bacterium]|nr:hypothetical protein [Xanthobacteraceae bacterium]